MALAVRSEFELLTVAYETSDFSHEDGLDRHKILGEILSTHKPTKLHHLPVFDYHAYLHTVASTK